MEYTRNDVIMWSDDEKLKIGEEYFFSDSIEGIVKQANNRNSLTGELIGIDKGEVDYPFTIDDHDGDRASWHFLILKKEPEKKTVQLDFDIREDREMLRGKTLIHNNPLRSGDKEECEVKGFFYDASDERWEVVISNLWGNRAAYCEQSLFHSFIFADTGKPVGKEVEE